MDESKTTIKSINRLTGYGILLFLLGFLIGSNWIKYLQLLMPIGSLLTFLGIFLFFKKTNLREQFKREPKEDILTYFWNVIALKLWTFIFALWMILMNKVLISDGFI